MAGNCRCRLISECCQRGGPPSPTTTPLCDHFEIDERCWCQDPICCDDCGAQPVEYVRSDLVSDAIALRKALEAAKDWIAEATSDQTIMYNRGWHQHDDNMMNQVLDALKGQDS